jgi:hypothetical protein
MNAEQYSLLIKALRHRPTIGDIAMATGLTRQTVAKTLKVMRHQAVAYIAEWEQDDYGRWKVARWALGDSLDAEKPKAITSAEKQRAYRDRLKAK